MEPRPVELDGGIEARPWFTPGHGDALSHRVAKAIGRARRRIRIASPVLTAGPILGTLVEVVNEQRCEVRGVIDQTQSDDVVRQWSTKRRERVEDPAPADDPRARVVRGEARRLPGRGTACRTSCTRRSSSPTTCRSSAPSTSRARASGTRRTWSSCTTPGIADRLAAYVDGLNARYPRAQRRVVTCQSEVTTLYMLKCRWRRRGRARRPHVARAPARPSRRPSSSSSSGTPSSG